MSSSTVLALGECGERVIGGAAGEEVRDHVRIPAAAATGGAAKAGRPHAHGHVMRALGGMFREDTGRAAGTTREPAEWIIRRNR